MPQNATVRMRMWRDSDHYASDMKNLAKSIVKSCRESESEAGAASVFENELYYSIRSNTGIKINFSKEAVVSGVVHTFGKLADRKSGKGRLDAVVNNIVIEYKHYSKLQSDEDIQTAIEQITDYLVALKKESDVECDGILTSGVKVIFFTFKNGSIVHSSIYSLGVRDVELIIGAILSANCKTFTSTNVVKDFAVRSDPNYESITKTLARDLFDCLTNNPTSKTKMLFEEWKSLMHLSLDDSGKSSDLISRRKELSLIFNAEFKNHDTEYKALYALQTTYAVLVKLIACKVINQIKDPSSSKPYDLSSITSLELQHYMQRVEDGYSYKNCHITNFLEGDFFSWYSDENQWSESMWKGIRELARLIDEYTTFNMDFTYKPIDIFKDLYMSIIPRPVRHSMGEYFTPNWLAEHVISESIRQVNRPIWKAIDPCCGSGIFLIELIKKIVADQDIHALSDTDRRKMVDEILSRVYGVDINPLSVLSARVGYYIALQQFGTLDNFEIPVYLGDSAIIPTKVIIDNILCYKYSITNQVCPFDVVLPARMVKSDDFSTMMSNLQQYVELNDSKLLLNELKHHMNDEELNAPNIVSTIELLADNLVYLHTNNWDGIWVRIATNYMLIARLSEFDIIVGNPPWVKWEHLPTTYADKIKDLCYDRHLFSGAGMFGGVQLNICALISNVTASNWLSKEGVLAFLMPDSIVSQNSYEGFRNFYIDYENNIRLYLQKLERWLPPLRPFYCGKNAVTQDFNTYYYGFKHVDYKEGTPVVDYTRNQSIDNLTINKSESFDAAAQHLTTSTAIAKQLSHKSTVLSIVKNDNFSEIIGPSDYDYRTGAEFTPFEVYMFDGFKKSKDENRYLFKNQKFKLAKYRVEDMPPDGWDLETKYMYPMLKGPDISRFKYQFANHYCLLPYDPSNTSTPVSIEDLLKDAPQTAKYLIKEKPLIESQSESSKAMHRGEEFYAISKLGPYTYADNIVAVRDNADFCACVIDSEIDVPWEGTKKLIGVKHTILIGQDKKGRFITNDEAYYLCGLINSSIIRKYIMSNFKSNGYTLKKSNLFIPKYNEDNETMKKISELCRTATKDIDEKADYYSEKLSELYLDLCHNLNKK